MQQGQIQITKLEEETFRTITFQSPLVVDWYVTVEKGNGRTLEICLDNGIRFDIQLSSNNPHPAYHFTDASKENLEENVRKCLCFEFMHSFFHPHEDPNYNLLNWALYGNFKDCVTAVEDEEAAMEA